MTKGETDRKLGQRRSEGCLCVKVEALVLAPKLLDLIERCAQSDILRGSLSGAVLKINGR